MSTLFFGAIIAVFTGSPAALLGDGFQPGATSATFDHYNRFVMGDYDEKKPFASFLAGIGGKWGMPAWSFYVNRGQGMAAFGTKDKNGGIQRFETAEKAYANVPLLGFRTMVKGKRSSWLWGVSNEFNHQPFFPKSYQESSGADGMHRSMSIGMNEMEIHETYDDLGLDTNILYFTAPNEEFPALIRKVTFTNTASGTLSLDVLDGLAQMFPYGPSNDQLDTMGRTIEAYYRVYNVEEGAGRPVTDPFYHISQSTTDAASVQLITAGNYVTAFIEDGDGAKLPFIVDPTVIFGQDTTLAGPQEWYKTNSENFDDFMEQAQGFTARTPCAFAGAQLEIQQGESVSIISVYGQAPDELTRRRFTEKVRKSGYVSNKRDEAEKLAHSITDNVKISTGVELFDLYVAQDYLDNVLRGGLPHKFGVGDGAKIYHIFSRIHGDLERDYNNFLVEPTYFSQGPGNFRDVNQNRRVDVSISPEVRDFNIRTFLSFCQLDGYNPLSVASSLFKVMPEHVDNILALLDIPDEATKDTVTGLLTAAFRPGSLIADLTTNGVALPMDRDGFVEKLLTTAIQQPAAQFAQNGFWSDHWSYTLDLVDNFESVYPDQMEWLMYDTEPLPSFIAPALVKDRVDRYSLVPDADCDAAKKDCTGVSTVQAPMAVTSWGDDGFSEKRMEAINFVNNLPDHLVDATNAANTWHPDKAGNIVTASVIAKFAMLGIVKFSTMDPFGMGVEYEGGKPGWNDAMNGLPGLLGSGMPETYEMLRILKWVKRGVDQYERAVDMPEEFGEFMEAQLKVLDEYNASDMDADADFKYWDDSNTAREAYRKSIEGFLTGRRSVVSATDMSAALDKMIVKVELGIDRAVDIGKGLSPAYFRYEAVGYTILEPTEVSNPPQPTQVKVTKFKMHSLPYFLEGPVRHFKVMDDKDEMRKSYERVRSSSMYDEAMQQYYVCEDLADMRQDLGRMKAFSPGWLENQSIWLHMSYKFYLELLRGGLYEEFFKEIETGLVPFMDNEVYGRSPLEASSFIVSSVFPDAKMHGEGFQARLSGSTAEFMSMYLIMMSGEKPFKVDDEGNLVLEFKPVLPKWLWKVDGTISYTFLGKTTVTYTVPEAKDSWKLGSVKGTTLTYADGATVDLKGGVISSKHAEAVRDGSVVGIDVAY